MAVGDVKGQKGQVTQISTKEGELLNLSPNDDFAAAPGLLNYLNNPPTTAPMVQNAKGTEDRLDKLISNMEEYFGFGGKVSREMGQSVVGSLESVNRIS